MEEIWKDIKGFEGKYQISNMGRVKSLNFNNTGKEKIMKTRINNRCEVVKLANKDKKPGYWSITRLLIENFDLSQIYGAEKISDSIYKFKQIFQYKGKIYKSRNQLASAFNINPSIVHGRMSKKTWTLEEALQIPRLNPGIKLKIKLFNYNGKLYSLKQLSKLSGLLADTIYGRLRSGWSIEEAVEIPLCETNNKKGYNGKGVKSK